MAGTTVSHRDAKQLEHLLNSPEVVELVAGLKATRWTGRPGYPIRAMVGMALAKSLYTLPTWTRTVALVREHAALRAALGCADDVAAVPSVYACYRFTVKLHNFKPLLDACIASVLDGLHDELPELGEHVAIDGSDLPAYANGQRYVSKGGKLRERFSDPDASWGHRSAISTRKGGGFYGYKLHAAVCTATGLPVAWETHTAKDAEVPVVPSLLDSLADLGIRPAVCIADKGYDVAPFYDACESRDIRPVAPLRQTPFVKAGKAAPPSCDHGVWTFAGSDTKRGAAKYRCPSGECSPRSVWVKADRLHTLIPRETARWRKLYKSRAGVEREFGRLKHEWALLPLRVRGVERVRLHADLTILSRLAVALAKARAIPLAA
ncbi:MAG TPA: transposase [Acidimicrobiales bacterium]|nr:transposase [Acidimicrobiales bacterium]